MNAQGSSGALRSLPDAEKIREHVGGTLMKGVLQSGREEPERGSWKQIVIIRSLEFGIRRFPLFHSETLVPLLHQQHLLLSREAVDMQRVEIQT